MCVHMSMCMCVQVCMCVAFFFFLFYKLHLVLDSISVNKTGPIVSETI